MTWRTDPNVGESSTTTGTGPLFLGGALAGYRSFGEVCQNGDMFIYTIQHTTLAEWEEGIGVWNAGGAVTRLEPIKSSNGGALVSFSAGTLSVTIGTTGRIGTPAYSRNILVNGAFEFSQRQVPTTPFGVGFAGGRNKGVPDFWFLTTSSADADYAAVDTIASKQTNLRSRYYGRYRKTSATGKVGFGEVIEATETANLRGLPVRFSVKMRRTPNAMTARLGMIALGSGGVMNTVPFLANAFWTAVGAAGTDPTLGSNLTYVAPLQGEGGAVVGNAVTCVLSAQFERFTGTFLVPDTALNIIPFAWSDGILAVNDIVHFGEAGLYDTEDVEWTPTNSLDEFTKVQRRYMKTFPLLTAPAQNSGVSEGTISGWTERAGAVTHMASWDYPTMSAGAGGVEPTSTTYNPSAANANARNPATGTDGTSLAVEVNLHSLTAQVVAPAGWGVGQSFEFHATLDSSL